jgi:hypothetical protein
VVWELVFMLVILKIPVVYLCAVVWYAIRAEPEPEGGQEHGFGETEPKPWRPWVYWRRPAVRRPRPRRGGPHGSGARTYGRAVRPTTAGVRRR